MSLQLRRGDASQPDRVARLRIGDPGAALDIAGVAQNVGDTCEFRSRQVESVVVRAADREPLHHVDAEAWMEREGRVCLVMVVEDVIGVRCERLPRRMYFDRARTVTAKQDRIRAGVVVRRIVILAGDDG